MSDAASRQTQPIATVVLPGVARISVLTGQHNDIEGYEVAPGDALTFAAEGATTHAVESGVESDTNQACLENLEGVVTIESLAASSITFVRRHGSTVLDVGQLFKVGDQTLRVVEVDEDRAFTWKDGTQLFTSPRRQSSFAVQQIMADGRIGASASVSEDTVVIGAQDSTLLLGHAPTVSSVHATVQRGDDGQIILEDHQALNGVYVAVPAKEALENGALFWVGDQLMRLDVTA